MTDVRQDHEIGEQGEQIIEEVKRESATDPPDLAPVATADPACPQTSQRGRYQRGGEHPGGFLVQPLHLVPEALNPVLGLGYSRADTRDVLGERVLPLAGQVTQTGQGEGAGVVYPYL